MTIHKQVAAVVLAAGVSRRTGSVNKLLDPAHGKTMIECTVDAVLQSRCHEVVIVTGYQAPLVEAAANGRFVMCAIRITRSV